MQTRMQIWNMDEHVGSCLEVFMLVIFGAANQIKGPWWQVALPGMKVGRESLREPKIRAWDHFLVST